MLAGPSLAASSVDAAGAMQVCCPDHVEMRHAEMNASMPIDCMQMDLACGSDRDCSSPDCSMTASSTAAGTLDGYLLTTPGPGLETRGQIASSRPRNFALPIPKHPPKA
jgi:hypothetical protein